MLIGTAFSALLAASCLLIGSASGLGIPIPEPITFAFVVDVSGSMSSEISYVRKAIYNTTDHLHHYKMLGIDHFVLSSFNDPKNLTTVAAYSSLRDLHRNVSELKATGGGDCPEYGLDGLDKAIKLSRRNSFIFYFSDAGVKEDYKKISIANAANAKNIKIWIIGSGCCSPPCKNYRPYIDIASMTGGVYYPIMDKNIPQVMKYVNYNVRCGRLAQLRTPPTTYAGIVSWLDSHPGCVVPPPPPTLPPTTGATGLAFNFLVTVMASVVASMII